MKYAPSRCLSYASLSLLLCLLSSCKESHPVSEPAVAPAKLAAPATTPRAESVPCIYYTVELTDCGRSEAQVISELLRLKPDMLHNNAKRALRHLPYVLAEKVIESEAHALKSCFETVGATILIKPL